MKRHRNAGYFLPIVFLSAVAPSGGWAAPYITEALGAAPFHAQRGATIGLFAQGLTPPVRVFFSDGSNPTVEASPVDVDWTRGIVLLAVPAGATTGAMKLSSGGVDSNPYLFRVDVGAFDQGTSTLSGQVTNGIGAVAGAAVVLLAFDGCEDDVLWDHAITDANGHYAVTGHDGEHWLFVFPPESSGLAGGGSPVVLTSTPTVANVTLGPGVLVTGRVVRAASPATGVANSRVEVDSDAGFDTRLTDATGGFSMRLSPGNAQARVRPPVAEVLASTRHEFEVPALGPQVLADIALQAGVRISGVARSASGLTPLPNLEISAQVSNACCDDVDAKLSAGDGSFTLVVPPGQSYEISARVGEREPYADARLSGIVVASSDITRNVDFEDAGAITGTVVDADTGDPVAELNVQASAAPYSGQPVAYARTCMDGTYRLRVPPVPAGYLVTAGFGEENGYVAATWDGSAAGTLYACEGNPVAVPSAGGETADVDFELGSGAVAVSGNVRSQSSGCVLVEADWFWVTADDGESHMCSLGAYDWSAAPGSYRIYGLPSSELVSDLRLCVSGMPNKPGQCWDGRKSGSSFDPVAIEPGQTASGIDFCVGNVPVEQTQALRASKVPGGVTFAWDPTNDPYQTSYRLRGATTARPSTAPGSFPLDPGFVAVYDAPGTSAFVPLSQIFGYYLVTNVGPTGIEGPSGSYAP